MKTLDGKRNIHGRTHRGLATTLTGSVLALGVILSTQAQPASAAAKNKLCSEAIYVRTAFRELPSYVNDAPAPAGFRAKIFGPSKSIYAHIPQMVAAIRDPSAKKTGLAYSTIILPQYRSLIASLKATKNDQSAYDTYRGWLDRQYDSVSPESLGNLALAVSNTIQSSCGFALVEIDGATPSPTPGPVVSGPVVSGPAVAGGACDIVGYRAEATNLDCVLVGGKNQWQPRGSKLNPYMKGETFTFTAATESDLSKADFVTRSITVNGYLPDAAAWVLSHPNINASQVIDAANGKPVRGVSMKVTVEKLRPENMSNIGSLTDYWLGDEGAAGCCESNGLIWGQPPSDALDFAVRLAQGETRQGNMVFPATNAELGSRPIMRIGWNNPVGNQLTYVYFSVNEVRIV
jgi:hypothetical protein